MYIIHGYRIRNKNCAPSRYTFNYINNIILFCEDIFINSFVKAICRSFFITHRFS